MGGNDEDGITRSHGKTCVHAMGGISGQVFHEADPRIPGGHASNVIGGLVSARAVANKNFRREVAQAGQDAGNRLFDMCFLVPAGDDDADLPTDGHSATMGRAACSNVFLSAEVNAWR